MKSYRPPYFVSYLHYSKFGQERGYLYFNSFSEAQSIAVEINSTKNFALISWGSRASRKS